MHFALFTFLHLLSLLINAPIHDFISASFTATSSYPSVIFPGGSLLTVTDFRRIPFEVPLCLLILTFLSFNRLSASLIFRFTIFIRLSCKPSHHPSEVENFFLISYYSSTKTICKSIVNHIDSFFCHMNLMHFIFFMIY